MGKEAEVLEEATGATAEVFAGHRWGEQYKATRWARAVATSAPTWISGTVVPALAQRFSELAPHHDRVVLLDDYSAVYLDVLAGNLARFPPVVIDKHNVMGASSAEERSGVRTVPRLRFDLHLVRRFERRATQRASAVIVTSEEEADRAVALYGCPRPSVVRSGVEIPPSPWRPTSSSSVLCLANFHYRPNRDGVVAFVRDGWPELADEANLNLVGSAPAEVAALDGQHHIRVRGFVEDLSSVVMDAAVGIAPLWAGAGVKLKTLTMLAAGMPVVATPVALEGIDAHDGVHCLVAATPAEMATSVRRLLQDRDLGATLGAAGRALVQEHYTWSALGRRFVMIVENVASTERSPGVARDCGGAGG